jgi:diguanylate cyclase (GGDEF)-like protein
LSADPIFGRARSTFFARLASIGRWFSALVLTIVVTSAVTPSRAWAGERWAAPENVVFTHDALDGQMPNSAVPEALAEDGAGFLWVGTQNGLARWDGYRFRTYKPQPDVDGSVPDSVITALHADRLGRLWVGTASAGLARYDRSHDRFVRYRLGSPGARAAAIFVIADDGNAGIWVATAAGVEHLNGAGVSLERLRHDPHDRRSLPSDGVHVLLRDRSGALWAGTAAGVARRSNGAAGFAAVTLAGLPLGSDIDGLLQDDLGRIWIATTTHGVYVAASGSTQASPVRGSVGGTPLADQPITSIVQARTGEVWVGTPDKGIIAIQTSTMHMREIRHNADALASIPNDSIVALYRDRAGLLWVGTMRSLSHCDPRQTAISSVVGSLQHAGVSTFPYVTNILAAADGRIWTALGNGGVDRLDARGQSSLPVRFAAKGALNAVRSIDIDVLTQSPRGDVYLGGHDGLYRFDSQLGAIVPVPMPVEVRAAGVSAILYHDHALWFGNASGFFERERNGRIRQIAGPGTGLPLTDPRVIAIEPGPSRSIWIGTSNGLNRFDPRTHRVERIFAARSDPAALAAGNITTIMTDRTGDVWIGTEGDGINILHRDAAGIPRFRRLGVADGLPNDDVSKLLEDGRGHVWASTDNGLAIIDETTFAIRALHRADGVGIESYYQNSGGATRNGKLIFGGVGGLTVVDPAAAPRWQYRPPVVVTQVSVAEKVVPRGNYDGGRLEVAPGAGSFAVEFSALDYSAPQQNRYAYRLEGFDSQWIDVDASRRFASYTNVPPGVYRLAVRGSNRDGAWSDKQLALIIRVLPAWYQTIAFRLASVIAAIFCIILVIRMRTALARRRQHELESSVAARTAELHVTQRELERLAYYDMLTGLPNRRMFADELQRLLDFAAREGLHAGMVLVDLDAFKAINDSFGHDVGDAVLVEAARRLQEAVRGSDVVARLGGDEFAILLPQIAGAADVELVCRRIIDSFVEPIVLRGATVLATPSLGSAEFPRDGDSQEAIYKSADLALYAAKRAGRNTWESYRADSTR